MGFIGKILFTMAVIAVVYIVYRNRSGMPAAKQTKTDEKQNTGSLSSQTLAYIFIGLIISVSALIFTLNWFERHKIFNIHVINGATNEVATYQAYKKTIEGRSFITLDGRTVTVGESERMEIIEAE